jgi:hypothetical protein
MKKLLLVALLFISSCALASKHEVSITATSVNDDPAIQIISEVGSSTTVVRTGTDAQPTYIFPVTSCGFWKCPNGHSGILSISAQGVHWQSSSEAGDNFDLPLASAKFYACWMGGLGACVDVSGNRHIFLPNQENGKVTNYRKDFFKIYFKLLSETTENFAGADSAFWQLRGARPPQLVPPIDDAFRVQVAAWRALPVKPALSADANKQRVLAESYLREKDFKSAIEHYELGLKDAPMWPEGWFNLALLYGETGNFRKAADRMKHYLELLPDSPDAVAAHDKIIIWEDKAEKK